VMKKLAIAAAAAASLTAGVANAYTVGTFSNGFVVPNVIFDASGTTAVGLVNQSGGTRAVYWTFFNQNSQHITDGCFTLTDKQYSPFIWSAQAGTGLSGTRGYLVFAAGATDSTGATAQTACGGTAQLATTGVAQISGNAFQVDLAAKSVAFTPVIDGALTLTTAQDLTVMGADSLTSVVGAAQVTSTTTGPQFSMRYAIDGATGGTDTRIVVWSTGNQAKTHTVNIYNNAQGRKSVNFTLTQTELDFFDPETIVGRPADYLDGFIEWTPNLTAFYTGTVTTASASVVTYSIISAPAFGAVQTILGAHR